MLLNVRGEDLTGLSESLWKSTGAAENSDPNGQAGVYEEALVSLIALLSEVWRRAQPVWPSG